MKTQYASVYGIFRKFESAYVMLTYVWTEQRMGEEVEKAKLAWPYHEIVVSVREVVKLPGQDWKLMY